MVESEQDRSSRGPRNARGRGSDEESKRSNETESGKESGNVGKRGDAVQLGWNVSRKFVRVEQWWFFEHNLTRTK